MADLDELFVYQFDTPLTRDFQKLDLRLDQEIESKLGYEKTWPRSCRISDRCPDIESGEVCGGVYRFQGVSEY